MKKGLVAQSAQTEHIILLRCLFFSSPLTSVWPLFQNKHLPELFFCFTIETSWTKPSLVRVHLHGQSWAGEWHPRDCLSQKCHLGNFFYVTWIAKCLICTELNILTAFFTQRIKVAWDKGLNEYCLIQYFHRLHSQPPNQLFQQWKRLAMGKEQRLHTHTQSIFGKKKHSYRKVWKIQF